MLLQLVQIPAVIIGLIALLGLLLQGKSLSATITGTVKTILSVLIIAGGASVLIDAIGPIQEMFNLAVPTNHLKPFITFDEGAVGAIQSANIQRLGLIFGLTLIWGYLVHLIISRITRHRFIYLTGHMIWIHAAGFALIFHTLQLGDFWTIALAGIVDGAYMTFAPAIAQPFMKKITGRDDIGFGHGQTTLNVAFGYLGKVVGDPKKSTENMRVPKSLDFFRDVAVSTSAVMLVVTFMAAGGAVWAKGADYIEHGDPHNREFGITGGQNWMVFSFMQALTFTAGMMIMLYGVRLLIAEIVPAFKGIGMKIVPNAIPALDVPVIFPFAPKALVIGLIVGFGGQLAGIAVLAALDWPVPIPSVIVAFFASGAAAIFANATGGLRGAVVAAFGWGFVGWLLISAAYKFDAFGDLTSLRATDIGFTVPDLVIPALIILGLKLLMGPIAAAVIPVLVVLVLVIFSFDTKRLVKSQPATEQPADGSPDQPQS
ncbi:hypothetical protein BSR29_01075 [Boudabousia liubingyangii]|uniref:Ascorbate-specific PTS system EIIC component n=1 Tax=Boudabousia liubingyangii TaxID=1921764 RepID=A0A1Q5PPR4_9ACTO|nr:hypothetical protein BSR29_01075 [Boudabousia liubingyangii]